MDPKETREIEIVLKAQQANASLKDMGAGVALLNNQLAKMTADDPRRAALKRDFDVLSQRVGEARKELKTYVLTEEEARLATEKLNDENQQVILNGQKVNSSFKDMRASAGLLEQQLHEMNGDEPGRKKLLADYHSLQDRIEGVSHELTRANANTSFFKQGLANAFAFATGGIEALAGKVIDVGKDIFETTAKFETFETVLTNALGDNSKAKKALADIQDMAAKTPFSVEELTASYLKFVNRGLTPSMEQMTKMGDIAASQGKSFDQLTEAVLDAGTGEFERLKEFGISASKSGDQVSLSFKGVNQTVKATPEAINGAILKFGDLKGVAGNMAAVSKTLDGTLSNLGDTTGQLEVKLGAGLKPVFMLILGLFGQLLGWVGRFVEQAGPLKVIFSEIMDVFMDLYHDIGDVLESLGLFSDKTDTVKLAVEALKFVLTFVLLPIKTLALAARGIVDTFVDWYNKSELLRGILGGLGAVVMSLFNTIKNDALKILGGVGDIIVGIFTLDKNKILAGFKAALSATADAALVAGDRAAAAFSKGYLDNKDNHITRTVRVKTQTEEDGNGPSTAGVDLKSDPSSANSKKADAAAKKAKADRDRADRERLADLKKWVKDEGDILDQSSELERARQTAANTDELKRREAQRQKIIDDASKKYQDLLVLDGNHTQEMVAVLQERDLKLRELHAKFAEEDEKQRQQELEAKRKTIEADTQEAIGALENTHALGLVNEQEYQAQLYYLRKKGLDDQLALLVAAGQGESDAAKKIQGTLLKLTADRVTSEKKQEQDLHSFNLKMAGQAARLLADGLQLVEDNLDQKGEAYQAFKALRKTAELAELGINLAAEIQAIWKAASENPLNGVTAGAAGTTQGVIQTGFAVARATAAGIKIAGFAKGGATGDGKVIPMAPNSAGVWEVMRQATGLSIGGSGKLQDAQGLEVAGIVHKNEYVIPEWMRADPQVLQVEDWLEARRLRGYAQGGATSDGGRPGSAADARPATDATLDPNARLVEVLASLDQRLQKVEQWPTQLDVVLDLLQLDREQAKLKKIKASNGVN
ncbi:MAG: hypothetical protein ACRYFK_07375 [Janthinobacterium lividum]